MNAAKKALLIDLTRCIGCQLCVKACKEAHGLPQRDESHLSPTALTVVEERKGHFVRRLCMHCEDPTCASVCPVGALEKTAAGPVIYHPDRCMGCRYCLQACPFQVPRYEWDHLVPYVKKCDMCADRVARGETTACAAVCPVAATVFGDREQLLAEARRRIEENPAYVRRIYGTDEAGGTSVFFLSDVPFEQLGFASSLINQPMPTLSAAALNDVPVIVMVGASLLAALYWITERREKVALAEREGSAELSSVKRLHRGDQERS